jgi:hypothetical protein
LHLVLRIRRDAGLQPVVFADDVEELTGTGVVETDVGDVVVSDAVSALCILSVRS